jgi:pimeloyl-ACP methyl ester carboxylesterase
MAQDISRKAVASFADNDPDAVAQQVYDALFTARDNDTVGAMPYDVPDVETYTDWLQWYRDVELEQWSLPYSQPRSGQLAGFFLPHPVGSHRTAVVVHGVTSSHLNVGAWVRVFYELGFNILTPDLRGHGANIDPDVDLTKQDRNMGIYDSQDLVGWMEQIVQKRGSQEQIVVLGYSLGAAVALQAISNDALPANVVAIVDDCGFCDLHDSVLAIIAGLYQAGPDTAAIYEKVDDMLYARQTTRIENGIVPDHIRKDVLPLLAVQGENDGTVFPAITEYVLSIYGGQLKQSYFVPGAGHAQSIAFGYAEYQDHIRELLLTGDVLWGQVDILPASVGLQQPTTDKMTAKISLGSNFTGYRKLPSFVTCRIVDDDSTGTVFEGGVTEMQCPVLPDGIAELPMLKFGTGMGNFSIAVTANITSVPARGQPPIHKTASFTRLVTYLNT